MQKYFLSLFFLIQANISFAAIDSYCQKQSNGQPISSEQLVILLDLSDPYEQYIDNIHARIIKIIDEKPPGTRVSLFVFDGVTGFHTSSYKDSFCISGKYEGLSKIFLQPNDHKRRKRLESKRINEFLNQYKLTPSSVGSPIIDAIQSSTNSQIIQSVATSIDLIVISDLVEYSNDAKLVNKPLLYTEVDSILNGIRTKLKPIKNLDLVTFLYLQRQQYIQIQGQTNTLEIMWDKIAKSISFKKSEFFRIQ